MSLSESLKYLSQVSLTGKLTGADFAFLLDREIPRVVALEAAQDKGASAKVMAS